MKNVILLGYFIEVYDLCKNNGYNIVGYVDNNEIENALCPYLGNDDTFIKTCGDKESFMLVNVPDSPKIREDLYRKYHEEGFQFETVISSLAKVSESAEVGEGCIVTDFSNISSKVKLGKCVRVNVMGNIMHESKIGDFTSVAPNAVILGRCNIGSKSYIGANATILPGRKIYSSVIIGAGAVVNKDIVSSVTVAGVPAHEIEHNHKK